MTPKRRSILSLIFVCICFTKSLRLMIFVVKWVETTAQIFCSDSLGLLNTSIYQNVAKKFLTFSGNSFQVNI